MQATVRTFDPTTRTGTVITGTGAVLDFPADAFDRSGLRLLHPGQRVEVLHAQDGDVALVTLVGFPTSEPGAASG